jgi:hypothetical protein
MTGKPDMSHIEFHHGESLLFGPSVRTFVVDTLFEIGLEKEKAAALWTAATTDTGPDGDRARQFIERATNIGITIQQMDDKGGSA